MAPAYAVAPRRSNGWGIAGFVASLVSVLTCGLLSPISALLSFIGVFKAPRGLAVTGLVLSLFQMAVWGVGAVVLGPMAISGYHVGRGAVAIAQYATAHNGAVPSSSGWQQVVTSAGGKVSDYWGRPLRYERISDTEFDLASDGADGVPDTSDDIAYSKFKGELPFRP
jgi:hypothetical protein